ncbi:hypothetical protein UPYG_G00172520 [Umbra pygmaea]|uniref:AXH domain-containing protein n=1 Tax=Umbra pygmaea TaxID=75934 RepID=A0ABD0WTK9_UMBPY
MSTTPSPDLGSGRESLPPKKRDPRPSLPEQPPTGTFKVPFPYKSHNVVRPFSSSHSDLFPPIPASVPPLYQPWTQSATTTTPARANTYHPSPSRDCSGWPEWREYYYRGWAAVPSGWDIPYVLHDRHTQPSDPSRYPSICRNTAQPAEAPSGLDGEYRCHFNKTVGQKLGPHTAHHSNGRQRGPYMRKGKLGGHKPRPSSGTDPAPPNNVLTQTIYRERHQHIERVCTHQSKANRYPPLGQRPPEVPAQPPTRPSSSSDQSKEQYWTVTDTVGVSPPRSSSPLPWLLPHFAAGSLIELRDGRLRRVEDLQAEDFLIGAEACPELRLSSCTVQSISPSSAPTLSRLLVLLHEEHSQEYLDVYMEYPFFVRGRGWSSCHPQGTARLCGLRCHQLSVGDVCLALIPTSPSNPVLAQPQGQDTQARREHEWPNSLQSSCPQPAVSLAPERPAEGPRTGLDSVRKRRWSAPELRGPGINCPY